MIHKVLPAEPLFADGPRRRVDGNHGERWQFINHNACHGLDSTPLSARMGHFTRAAFCPVGIRQWTPNAKYPTQYSYRRDAAEQALQRNITIREVKHVVSS